MDRTEGKGKGKGREGREGFLAPQMLKPLVAYAKKILTAPLGLGVVEETTRTP